MNSNLPERRISVVADAMERPPVLFAVSLLASVAMGFRVGLLPITAGLDASVIYAFNYASARHLEWGRDFLSTYGPYGYIIGTMDVGQLAWRGAVFNLLLAAASGPVAALYVQSLESVRQRLRVLSTLVLIYATSVQDVEYHWFSLFILMFLIGLRRRGWKGLVWHATAGLLAGFYLLMKLSLGIGALLTLLVGVLITGRREALYRMLLAGSAATAACVVGWFAYAGHAHGLATYLITGWQIASGYSSAMSNAPARWWISVGSFMVWFCLLGLWVLKSGSKHLTSLAVLVFPLFMAWKHSIVRQDVHVHILITFGCFVMAIVLIESGAIGSWRRACGLGGLVVFLGVAWLATPSEARHYGGTSLRQIAVDPLALRGIRELFTLLRFQSYRGYVAQESEVALGKSRLPKAMRATIGGRPVDIYPWEVSYLPANGLTWVNRPLPASFYAYAPGLDRLNARFFQSDQRPEYLVWHDYKDRLESIDGRFLLWLFVEVSG